MRTTYAILAGLALTTVAAAQNLRDGQPAPQFSIRSVEGKQLFLKDLQNNGPLFLYFIRNGDTTNNQAAPYIIRMIRAYTPGRAKWYGVMNERRDSADSWSAEFQPPFRLLLDKDMQATRLFQIESSPAIVLISADGKIMHQWQGFSGYYLKDLNRWMAKVNHYRKPKYFDFSRTPSSTQYGVPYTTPASHP